MKCGIHFLTLLSSFAYCPQFSPDLDTVWWCPCCFQAFYHFSGSFSLIYRLACGIIARSAGLFQNPKQICACDGVTLWEERDRPIAGKGRSKVNTETPAAHLWTWHTNTSQICDCRINDLRLAVWTEREMKRTFVDRESDGCCQTAGPTTKDKWPYFLEFFIFIFSQW